MRHFCRRHLPVQSIQFGSEDSGGEGGIRIRDRGKVIEDVPVICNMLFQR